MRQRTEITGGQADLLLYALDAYVQTDIHGKVSGAFEGFSREQVQKLRDRLFAIHDHERT